MHINLREVFSILEKSVMINKSPDKVVEVITVYMSRLLKLQPPTSMLNFKPMNQLMVHYNHN